MVIVSKKPLHLFFFHCLLPKNVIIDTIPMKSRVCGPGLPGGLLHLNTEDANMPQPSCFDRYNHDFPEG